MKKYILYIFAFISVFQLLSTSCKKVDDHANMVAQQPWLAKIISYYPNEWKYPTTVTVGDTVTLMGLFFPNNPGSNIKVGGVAINPVEIGQMKSPYNEDNASEIRMLDVVKFIITKDMGIGKRIPVSVTANGITVDGPAISIQYLQLGTTRTDTTLWVDKVFSWAPSNPDDYIKNGDFLVNEIHVDAAGNIYFGNAHGIYQYSGSGVKELFKNGDLVKDENGEFTLRNIIGNTVSYDGNTLYFSAAVIESSADTINHYIFRLCSKDMTSGKVTTLNRTMVIKSYAAEEEAGVRIEGTLSKLKVVARNLESALNGDLYFNNLYAPESNLRDHKWWYDNTIPGNNQVEPWEGVMNYIGRVTPGGNVKVIVSLMGGNTIPGMKVFSCSYFIDPNSNYLYGYTLPDNVNYELAMFDTNEGGKLAQYSNIYGVKYDFAFQSYDDDPKYKWEGPTALVSSEPYTFFRPAIQLADGNVLVVSSSLISYDFLNKTAYCYAGTETGMKAPPAEQNKTTGQAKWVDFYMSTLIGQDKTGAVYFCKGLDDYYGGVTIYKLYPKKP